MTNFVVVWTKYGWARRECPSRRKVGLDTRRKNPRGQIAGGTNRRVKILELDKEGEVLDRVATSNVRPRPFIGGKHFVVKDNDNESYLRAQAIEAALQKEFFAELDEGLTDNDLSLMADEDL